MLRDFSRSKWDVSITDTRKDLEFARYSQKRSHDNDGSKSCMAELLLFITDVRDLIARNPMLMKIADDFDDRYDSANPFIEACRAKLNARQQLTAVEEERILGHVNLARYYHSLVMVYIRTCTSLHIEAAAIVRELGLQLNKLKE
jgi:hypothetical protein